jgi:hypothetical protein
MQVVTDVDQNGDEGLVVSTPAIAGVPQPGLPRLVVGARITEMPALNPNLPLSEVCLSGGHTEGTVAELSVGGVLARGCHWVEEPNSADGPLESLLLVAVLPGGESLNLQVNWRTQSAGAHDLALEIAGTMRASP